MKKISVITVCFNSVSTIRDAIESVLAQTYPCIEYIVVDGGSTDGTREVIASYGARIARVVSEADEGIYDAMNKGIKLATGDAVGFLNADDIMANADVIGRVAAMFENGMDVSYGDLVYVSKNNIQNVERYWRSGAFAGEAALRRGWIPPHPTFYASRELLGAGFALEFRLAADYELMLRVLMKPTLRVGYVPEVLVRMRTGGATNKNLRNIVAQNVEILNAARKCGMRMWPAGFVARKILDKIGQRIKGKLVGLPDAPAGAAN